jgi:CHAT domain-containing protein/tetratricopeptide (TPR) repeat protein
MGQKFKSIWLVAGAWLSLAPAVAAQPAAERPAPAADAPATPEEAEFVRLVQELTKRQQADDAAGAAALIGQVVRLGEQVLGLKDPDFLEALEAQAEFFIRHERHAEALLVVDRLYAGRAALLGADDPKTIEALLAVAAEHGMTGDYAAAEPLWVQALERAERVLGREHPVTLMAVNNLGVLRNEQGRGDEAEPLLQRALAARERVLGQDHDETLDTLTALSTVYRNQGRFDEAEPLLRRVLAVRERTQGAAHPMTIYAMNGLATVLNLREDFTQSEALFERAEAQAAPLGPDHPHLFDALDGRVYAMLMNGRMAEAEPLARRALAGRERVQGPVHPGTLRSLGMLANIYLLTDRPKLAEPLLRRAMEVSAQRLGPEHPDTLLALENVLFARLRDDSSSANALEPARLLLAGARARRMSQSREIYGQLKVGGERRGGNAAQWYTMFADAAFADARAKGGNSPELLGEVFIALQEAVAGEATGSIARMAVRRVAEGRGDLGALVRERESLTEAWADLSQRIAQTFNGEGEEAEAERVRLRAERESMEKRMAAIDGRLRSEFPEYFDLVKPQPLQGPEAQQLLEPDEAVLIAVPGMLGTHVVAFSRDRAQWARADGKEAEVRIAVDRLRYDAGAHVDAPPELVKQWEADRPQGGRPSFDRATAYGLYRRLFEPVEEVLKGKKRVYVVAGESLAGLPFSMLVTQPPEGADDDPKALRTTSWLADRYALVHVPSVYSLALLRKAAGEPAAGGFIGFGDPVLAGKATSRGARRGAAIPAVQQVITAERTAWGGAVANVAALRQMEQLPGTARELKAMADIFGAGSSRVFTRAGATEAQVRRADLSQARVIAFATHGLTPGDPVGEASASELFALAEPGLVLTPPGQATAEDDGFLSASEVSTLRLNADWVILSACNTATGDAATAGLSQLARAFFYAGARNLLASHWPVDDEVAAKMTVRTLALEQAGIPRAEAFQQAMREIRSDPAHAEWAHPFYWSPFVLIGDGGK